MAPPEKFWEICPTPVWTLSPHEFPKFSKFSGLVSSPPPPISPPRKISQSVPVQNFSTCRGMPNTYKFKELSEKCLPEHEKLFCGHLLTIHPTSYQYLIKAYLSPLRPGKPDATR